MAENQDLTSLNNALNELIPVNESEILNSMLSEFRGKHFEVTGKDFQGLNQNNILYILMVAFSSRLFDSYFTIRFVISNLLLPSATNQYIEPYAQLKGLERVASTPATGQVLFLTTNVGIEIPSTTGLINNSNIEYTVDTTATSQNFVYEVASVSRTNLTVRYVLNLPLEALDHGMYTGQVVTFSGSTKSYYNGEKVITVVNSTTIEFTIPSIVDPDGDISSYRASYTGVKVDVTSKDFTDASNMSANESLNLKNTIEGINSAGRVTFTTIKGGGSSETEAQYKNRVNRQFRKVYTRYNENDVYDQLTELDSTLQRFKVRRSYPNGGEVTIYAGKSGVTEAEGNYSVSELAVFEDYLNSKNILGLKENGITVTNFETEEIDVTITDFVPNNPELTQAIQTNIENYFLSINAGESFDIDELRGVIRNSTTLNNISPTGFDLDAPASDVALDDYTVPYLGVLTITPL